MKKIALFIFVLASIPALSDSQEDMVEKYLLKKYPTITDGTMSIKVHEYDVDIKRERVELKIEIKDDKNKEVFEKLDKAKIGALFTEITTDAQNEITKVRPIELEVELDREFAPDEYLYKDTFLNE